MRYSRNSYAACFRPASPRINRTPPEIAIVIAPLASAAPPEERQAAPRIAALRRRSIFFICSDLRIREVPEPENESIVGFWYRNEIELGRPDAWYYRPKCEYQVIKGTLNKAAASAAIPRKLPNGSS